VNRKVLTAPKKKLPKSYGNGGYPSGIAKPCPTCYAPMHLLPDAVTEKGSFWTCIRHGRPSKP